MTFIYGGWQGNANNFWEESKCQAVCPAREPASPTLGCAYYNKAAHCIRANPQECNETQKCDDVGLCCEYECGGTRCQKNICPRVDPDIRCVRANDRNCTNSLQCGVGGLCCEYECGGTKCLNPDAKPAQESRCPAIKKGEVGICANMCETDESCSDGEICCGTPCGGTSCTQPISK